MDVEPWVTTVQVGHYLRPDPIWNNTERSYRNLHVPTEILGITSSRTEGVSRCETGISFRVRFEGGEKAWLSAAWFRKPTKKYPLCPAKPKN